MRISLRYSLDKDISAHRRNGGVKSISEGTLLGSLEGRSAFRLARFCNYHLTIKLVLVLMDGTSYLDYFEGLTIWLEFQQ